MRIWKFLQTVLLLSFFSVGLIACQKTDTPLPTAIPTAVVPTVATSSGNATEIPQATAPAVSGVEPSQIDWAPQVVYSSPAPGEEALLNGAITIRFDQPMNQQSVEENFAIEAQGASQTAVNGTFTWARPDTLIFTPEGQLKRQENYQVSISGSAQSLNGQALSVPVALQLQTVGFIQVSQVLPSDGSTEIATNASLTVAFNRPIVPLTSSQEQANLPQPLTITPEVKGKGEWLSTSIYRFTPDVAWAGATPYQVTVNQGLEDVTGGLLAEDYTWTFTTASPKVVSFSPEPEARLVNPTLPLGITFNMPMDPASTEGAISLTNENGETAVYTTAWSEDGQTITLKPETHWDLDTTYTLAVAATAQSATGLAQLGEESSSQISTVPFPSILNTYPENGSVTETWAQGFNIQFAAPMDWDTLEDKIIIEPAPKNVLYYPGGNVDYVLNDGSDYTFSSYLNFDYERNTQYTVTIPGSAADPFGNTLGRDVTFHFSTPGFPAMVSLNLAKDISQLSTSFPSTVEVAYVNVSNVFASLYSLGLPFDLITYPYNIYSYSQLSQPLNSWSFPVDTAHDEVGLLNLPLAGDGGSLPTGIYYLKLSAPEQSSDDSYWQNNQNLIIVADTNLVVKEMFGEAHVWATNIATGQSSSGLSVTLYTNTGEEIDTAVTDANGFASFQMPPKEFLNGNYLEGVVAVSSQAGQSGFGVTYTGWNSNVSSWQLGLDNVGYGDQYPTYTYLYTDRPIYRPGDTIYFKGIVRSAHYGRYTLPTPTTKQLTLASYNSYDEDGVNKSIEVTIDEHGTFSGEYTLPQDAKLGTYDLYFDDQDYADYRLFTVAEYRKPEFQVTLTPDKTEALRGEAVNVTLNTTYFFGGTASGLHVYWNIYDDTYQPNVPGPFYYFGDGGDFYYVDRGLGFGPNNGTFGTNILSGDSTTDANGNVVIALPADLLKDVKEGSRKITIEASVADLADFPISAHTSVIFHAAEGYVGVAPEDYISQAGKATAVNLQTTDWHGALSGNQAVEVVFYERQWQRDRTSQYNLYYTQWTPIDTEVARGQVTTNANGKGQVSFTPESGGEYIAVATITDKNGRTAESSTNIWVLDDSLPIWRTDPTIRTMDLIPDQSSYKAGDTARILVKSPFAQAVQAWLTIERGTLLEQCVITLNGSSTVLELPITDDYAPNMYVSVTAVKPVDNSDSPYADIRLGVTEITVPPTSFGLNINLVPQETAFKPGDTVVYDINVTNQLGQPVQADLSLALVDLAVLTLKEDNAPNILDAFYAEQPYRSQTNAGLFITGEGLTLELPLEGGGLGGGGGEALDEAAIGKLDNEDDSVRRDFPDTAYWTASITTDANGHATAEIPLPDSLTTWRLSTKAVTTDTLVGQASTDIQVSLPLLLRPVTPRFFTVNDQLLLGTYVNNNTNQAISAVVNLEANGLTLQDAAEQTVNVPANGRVLVRWSAVVNDVQFVDLTFRVSGGGYSDATKPTFGQGPSQLIPVYRYDAADTVGTAGILEQAGRRVEAILLPAHVDERLGSVEVRLTPSLAASVLDTLTYQNELYVTPTCPHGLANQLLPNVATFQAIQELGLDEPDLAAKLNDLINRHIAQILSAQHSTGAWGWCGTSDDSPYLTTYIALSLVKAQQSGFAVEQNLLDHTYAYLQQQTRKTAVNNSEANLQAFMFYVLAEGGQNLDTKASTLFADHRELLSPYGEAFLALALQMRDGNEQAVQTLISDLSNSAILSATGAHWEDAQADFANLGGDIRDTAVIIAALARLQADNTLTPQAVRWLMVARTVNHWDSPHENAWSLFALTAWMKATGELNANFDYSLLVNTQANTNGTFNQDNITSVQEISIPARQLVAEDVNFLDFQHGTGDGRLYYTVHLNSFASAEQVTAVSRGLTIERTYYAADCDPEATECQPITQIAAGQQVRVVLNITVPHDLTYAIIEDPLPAGAEGIDPNLNTSASNFGSSTERVDESGDEFYGYWGWWYFNSIEYRDEKVVFLADYLPAGSYQYTYHLQANIPGHYQVMPAHGYEEFFPEVNGRSTGLLFEITE